MIQGSGKEMFTLFPHNAPEHFYWHKFVQDLRHKWDENPRFCSRFWRNTILRFGIKTSLDFNYVKPCLDLLKFKLQPLTLGLGVLMT